MENLITLLSSGLLLMGCFLCVTGALGVLKFPDFYTRVHAASVTDTLATAMILIGLMLISPNLFVVFKLLFIFVFILFIGPVASHILVKTALKNKLVPVVKENEKVSSSKL